MNKRGKVASRDMKVGEKSGRLRLKSILRWGGSEGEKKKSDCGPNEGAKKPQISGRSKKREDERVVGSFQFSLRNDVRSEEGVPSRVSEKLTRGNTFARGQTGKTTAKKAGDYKSQFNARGMGGWWREEETNRGR